MNFNIKDRLLFLTLTGSHSYGLDTPESDLDCRGIAVAPLSVYLSPFDNFFQYEVCSPEIKEFLKNDIKKPDEKIDSCVFDLIKFVKLATACNPNIIELLYVGEKSIRYEHPLFNLLRENRHLILSKKAKFTFSGYSHSQLKRIKGHRKYLLDPPTKKPERKDFNLPEIQSSQYDAINCLIKSKLSEWEINDLDLDRDIRFEIKNRIADQIAIICAGLNIYHDLVFDEENQRTAIMSLIGVDSNLIDLMNKEHKYRTALRDYNQYINWKNNRNPVRAAMEAKYMMDCKHASHLVRLYRLGMEILEKAEVIIERPDREELLAIKNGAWSYEQLMEYVENMDQKLDKLYETSTLRHRPDIKKIEEICFEIIERFG